MFLNIFKKIFNDKNNNKNFNKIVIISFAGYIFSHILFGTSIIFIFILDTIYFLKEYLNDLLLLNNTGILKDNKLGQKKKDINLEKKIVIDPEFEMDKFKPYEINISDTILHISNNID